MVLPGTCSALEIRRVLACPGVALQLRGDIKEGDYLRLKAHFNGKEKIVGFDLSSGGGIVEEGLRIADLARRNKLIVYVAGECNSVCAFVFFSAAKRYVGQQAKIGVHSISNSRDIEDPSSILLTVKLARISAKLGVSNSAIGKMVTTRPTNIAYLDQADLSALDASIGNPFDCETGQHQQQNAARDEGPIARDEQ
jgi:hypothetical protein